MRIISGLYRGQQIESPPGDHVRPTGDRVRENIFNILDNKFGFDDKIVTEFFAGSGALGIEALSRGAAHCSFIDSDVRSVKTIESNAKKLKIEPKKFSVIKTEALKFISSDSADHIDFIFADPPYDWKKFDQFYTLLASQEIFNGSVLMYESEKNYKLGFDEFLFDERSYGITKISFFKVTKP